MPELFICPTVTAFEPHQYRIQIEKFEPFAERIHIDLMDGHLAPTVSPSLDQVWWPDSLVADIHLMYHDPLSQLENLIKLRPNMVIIHQEAEVDHVAFATKLREAGIKAGLAILQETPIEQAEHNIPSFDHVLIFSGDLGKHGGIADLKLLDRIKEIRAYNPEVEIGWDGGINDQNAKQLAEAGVSVLNVGGFIADAPDPASAYAKLKSVIEG